MLCCAFIVISSDAIFTGIVPSCDCWGSEDYVIYWYYFSCDQLEDLYTDLEVLSLPGLGVLWDPLLSPLKKVK